MSKELWHLGRRVVDCGYWQKMSKHMDRGDQPHLNPLYIATGGGSALHSQARRGQGGG